MGMTVIVDKRSGCHGIVDERGKAVQEANRFLRALRLRGLSPNTVRAYAYDLLAIYRWMKRHGKRLVKLRQSELVGFISEQRNQAISARSINRRLTVCLLLYRFLTDRDMERGCGISTPAGYYRGAGRDKNLGLYSLPRRRHLSLRMKVPRTLVEPLQVEQIKTALGTLKRYRDMAIIYFMLLCGLRSCELLALRLTQLCFEDKRVRIQGKGNKQRVLPLPPLLVEILRDYLRLERPGRCCSDRLFVVLQGKRRGKPMTACGLRSLLRYRRCCQPSITNANAHRFRHTFGTDMARAGVRLPVLQKIMGHADSSSTLQYVNLSMADIAEQYQRAIDEIHKRYKAQDKGE